MLHEWPALLGVLAALTLGVISPGPSFVMVARTAVAASRRQALAAALGMGVGGAAFATAALLGLQAVFHAVPLLYLTLKVAGGLYLCYLGFLIIRFASQPLAVEGGGPVAGGGARAFWLGLSTQVSNPKTAIVYASVFAAFLPPAFSSGFVAALLVLVFCVEAGWYGLVAVVLSADAPQRAYLSCKAWVDRVAGAVLLGLGLRLVAGAAREP